MKSYKTDRLIFRTAKENASWQAVLKAIEKDHRIDRLNRMQAKKKPNSKQAKDFATKERRNNYRNYVLLGEEVPPELMAEFGGKPDKVIEAANKARDERTDGYGYGHLPKGNNNAHQASNRKARP